MYHQTLNKKNMSIVAFDSYGKIMRLSAMLCFTGALMMMIFIKSKGAADISKDFEAILRKEI